MSTAVERVAGADDPATLAPLKCPRCGTPLHRDQDWCLRCGAAARTRLVPTPSWRVPVAVVIALVVLALLIMGWAFVALTSDSGPSTQTPTQQPAPPPAQPTG